MKILDIAAEPYEEPWPDDDKWLRLYVDDVRETPEGWTRAYSVNGAMFTITSCSIIAGLSTFIDLSLDHDLGDYVSDGGDGYRLIDWIAEYDMWPVNRPTVHSMNPVGIARIQGVIDTYGPY